MVDQIPPVLLAEDDANDIFFLERAFKIAEIKNPLIVVSNGQEAIWYLSGHAPYDAPRHYPDPCLLLLDLKMPLKNGFDVLAWIREQPRLRDTLPVVVLSSSGYRPDTEKALALGAREYLIKPSNQKDSVQLVLDLASRHFVPSDRPFPSHAIRSQT